MASTSNQIFYREELRQLIAGINRDNFIHGKSGNGNQHAFDSALQSHAKNLNQFVGTVAQHNHILFTPKYPANLSRSSGAPATDNGLNQPRAFFPAVFFSKVPQWRKDFRWHPSDTGRQLRRDVAALFKNSFRYQILNDHCDN